MIKQTYRQVVGTEEDLFFEIKDSYEHTTFPHSHDYYEFCLIVAGKQAFQINSHHFEASEGALIFFRPTDLHSKKYLLPGQHLTIAFPKDLFDALFTYLGEGFVPDFLLAPESSPVVYLTKAEAENIVTQSKRMFLTEIHDKTQLKMQYKIMLIQIFSKYFLEVQLDTQERMPKWFEDVIFEMQNKEYFSEGINAMLRISGTCHEHLCRLTKKYLKATPTQWINEQRLDHAARMLQFTDDDITTICFDVGFGNLSHFYHQFKKKFGISPAKYRKSRVTHSIL